MHLFELQPIEGDLQSGHTYYESQVILRREGVNKRLWFATTQVEVIYPISEDICKVHTGCAV